MGNASKKSQCKSFMSSAALNRSAVRAANAASKGAAYKSRVGGAYRNELSAADCTFLYWVAFRGERIRANFAKVAADVAKIHWTRARPHSAALPQAAGRCPEKSRGEPPLAADPLPEWLGKTLFSHPGLPPAR